MVTEIEEDEDFVHNPVKVLDRKVLGASCALELNSSLVPHRADDDFDEYFLSIAETEDVQQRRRDSCDRFTSD